MVMDKAEWSAVRGPRPKVDGSRAYWERMSEEERQTWIQADMAEAGQIDMACQITKEWGRYVKAVESMFAGTETGFVQGGAQLRRMLDGGDLIFLEPSEIDLARRLVSLAQPGNDGMGDVYTVEPSGVVSRDVYVAARAFFDANPTDRPCLIRCRRHELGRESASMLGSTSVVTKGGESVYGKWIGRVDLRLKQAYDGIVAASDLAASIQGLRRGSFEQAKVRAKISGLVVRDVDEAKGMYFGKIVSETELHVIQNIGCGLACIHAKEKLNRITMVGQKLSINYSGGCVRVEERSAASGIER